MKKENIKLFFYALLTIGLMNCKSSHAQDLNAGPRDSGPSPIIIQRDKASKALVAWHRATNSPEDEGAIKSCLTTIDYERTSLTPAWIANTVTKDNLSDKTRKSIVSERRESAYKALHDLFDLIPPTSHSRELVSNCFTILNRTDKGVSPDDKTTPATKD